MPVEEFDLTTLGLDWRLASRRLRTDARDDFWPDPLHIDDLVGTPGKTGERFDSVLRAYRPVRGTSFPVPKANFTVRDSIVLRPIDRLVYQALIDKLSPKIDSKFAPTVLSHRLRSAAAKWMFRSGVEQWKTFFDAAKERVRGQPGCYLVVTDVAQYFETIRFKQVRLQLEKLLADEWDDQLRRCVDTLIECLNAWSPYDGYGLVQNTDPSSFLGNVVLDRVDKAMSRDGFEILRYMDDIRIVVPDEASARQALLRLVSHLRELGLGLNSAKTRVIDSTSEEIAAHVRDEDPTIAKIELAIAAKEKQAVQGIVPLLFNKAEELLKSSRTDERIFRFCLNRINSLRLYRNLELPDAHNITSGVLRILVKRPAETDTFCRYLETAPMTADHTSEIERLLTSEPLCVYSWQNFLLWRVLAQRRVRSDGLMKRAYKLISGTLSSPEAGSAALYLGAIGTTTDREALARVARDSPGPFLKRCTLIAVQQLHKAERTRLFQDLAHNDEDSRRLVEYVEQLAEPRYVEEPSAIQIEDLPDSMPSVY